MPRLVQARAARIAGLTSRKRTIRGTRVRYEEVLIGDIIEIHHILHSIRPVLMDLTRRTEAMDIAEIRDL